MNNKGTKHEFACNAGKVTEYEVKKHIDTIMVGFRGFSKEVTIVKWSDRLVYMAHKGLIPKGLQVNHKDEDKENNCIENLELMTQKENCNYGTRNQRISQTKRLYSAVAC